MTMTRKEFLGSVVKLAATAGGAAVLAACGSSGGTTVDAATHLDTTATSCTNNGTVDTIASNHGHVLMVSKADVVAGVDKTYDIMGTATHTHSVTVTAAMFTMLKNDTTQMTMSTFDAANTHQHTITIACA